MVFRLLSTLIGVALLVKATMGLAAPQWFYGERQRQYASESQPAKLLVAPVVLLVLTVAAWYATIFEYDPWGWLVTGPLTALTLGAIDHVFRWEKHRQRMLRVVRDPNLWRVDCLLLVVGAVFLVFAMLVY